MARRVTWALLAMSAAACGSDELPDAAAYPDAGRVEPLPTPRPTRCLDDAGARDAGPGRDAGTDAGFDGGEGFDAGPGFDAGGNHGCTPQPDRPPPPVPTCGGDAFDERDWVILGGDDRRTFEVRVVGVTSDEVAVAEVGVTRSLTVPWWGPDLRDAFAVGDHGVLELSDDLQRLETDRAAAWRVRIPAWDRTFEGPVQVAYGDATCFASYGGFCDCGSGSFGWTHHALAAGCAGATIAPGATATVDGWQITNVELTRPRTTGTCSAGLAHQDGYVTYLQIR